ncbi:MAG: peptidoglycan editing factor PgeF [Candidatus Villigracilaceae bacterium]
MKFHSKDGLRYLTFDIFPQNVLHAVFTRRGGVSPAPWESLNVGGGIGDDPDRVRENLYRSFAALGRTRESIFDVWQVHSADAVFADAPRSPDEPYRKADIILTDRPEVTLFMRFADCVPILLHDPRRGVVALAHAGWLGTVRGASRAAVQAMQAHYGSHPADLLAAIGPSIGRDHYEVGADVIQQVRASFGKEAEDLLFAQGGKIHLDLWAANHLLLEQAGVGKIEVAGLCTACHLEDWFSHRAEKGHSGRFGVLMALKE